MREHSADSTATTGVSHHVETSVNHVNETLARREKFAEENFNDLASVKTV